MTQRIRVGLDLGGTKIAGIALDPGGSALAERRIPTPRGDYGATIEAVASLAEWLEREAGARASVGVGMPGVISPATGLVKNANSIWLIGHPFSADLAARLGREVRCANDANCFALSEATDGAGSGHRVVFGVILGTGVGGGIVVDGRVWGGANAIAGEWGHNEMPSRGETALPHTPCYCGRRRCIETFLSGPGLAADHARHADTRIAADAWRAAQDKVALDAQAIAALAADGDPDAQATMARYADRLARALATAVNVLDPDIVVLGGGLSNIDALYTEVAARLPQHVFSDRCTTPVVRNRHGDSSGVRGAAWLWPSA